MPAYYRVNSRIVVLYPDKVRTQEEQFWFDLAVEFKREADAELDHMIIEDLLEAHYGLSVDETRRTPHGRIASHKEVDYTLRESIHGSQS